MNAKPRDDAFELNRLIEGDATDVLGGFPEACVDLIATSPSYWTAVDYGDGRPAPSYGDYLDALDQVWAECERVLHPNGKMAINTALMPIPKAVIKQQIRHLKGIPLDIHQRIMAYTGLEFLELVIWQKQTSKAMLGPYPNPGNHLVNNTAEFIYVYRKPGKARSIPREIKEASTIPIELHRDLTQQVWWMYPQDVKRAEGHPAPFPEKLPGRLIRLYTFIGDVVLDPFCGTGTTCAVAKTMGRRWLGIDINPAFLESAAERIEAAIDPPVLEIGHPRWPTKAELQQEVATKSKTQLERKHKRLRFGRSVEIQVE